MTATLAATRTFRGSAVARWDGRYGTREAEILFTADRTRGTMFSTRRTLRVPSPTRRSVATGPGYHDSFVDSDAAPRIAYRQPPRNPDGSAERHELEPMAIGLNVKQQLYLPLDEILRRIGTDRVDEVRRHADGTVELMWLTPAGMPGGAVRRSMYFDGARGFLPVRLRLTGVPVPALPDWGQGMMLESRTTWTRVNGGWVPESYHVEDYQTSWGEPDTFDAAFEWERVNGPVTPAETDWHAFDLPPRTRVYDRRLGERVLIARTPAAPDAPAEPAVGGGSVP